MSEDTKAFYERYPQDMKKVQAMIPDTIKGFGALFQGSMKEGRLPVKTKELIALAIGLAVRCEPCINLHVKKCLEAGATAEEIMEAAAVAVMMQGGPSLTHLPVVVNAIEACTGAGA
jgi:AhpD family alkylhydroperoxidase